MVKVRCKLYEFQFSKVLDELKDRINPEYINDERYLGDDEDVVSLYDELKVLDGWVDVDIILMITPYEYKVITEILDPT
jgi:hypothetical protein